MTKEFKEALNTLWTCSKSLYSEVDKDSEKKPEFTWQTVGKVNLYEI
jgi:hypothetical protein